MSTLKERLNMQNPTNNTGTLQERLGFKKRSVETVAPIIRSVYANPVKRKSIKKQDNSKITNNIADKNNILLSTFGKTENEIKLGKSIGLKNNQVIPKAIDNPLLRGENKTQNEINALAYNAQQDFIAEKDKGIKKTDRQKKELDQQNARNRELGLPEIPFKTDMPMDLKPLKVNYKAGTELDTKMKGYVDKIPEQKITQEAMVKNELAKIQEHWNKYQTDMDYKEQYDKELGISRYQEMVNNNDKDILGRMSNDIMAYNSNLIDSLVVGMTSSDLLPFNKAFGKTNPYVSRPTFEETKNILSENSPWASTAGSLVGGIASQIAIGGMMASGVTSGLSLSKVSLSTKALHDINKVAIGLGTQIPQSIFQRDSVQELFKDSGEIGTEIARSAASWFVGGRFEKFFDNKISQYVLNPEKQTKLRQLFVGNVLRKAPVLGKVIPEIAETSGQMIMDIALGKKEYLEDTSLMAQEFAVDMISLLVLGRAGLTSDNKAYASSKMSNAKKEFMKDVSGKGRTEEEINIAANKVMKAVIDIEEKFGLEHDTEVQPLIDDLLRTTESKLSEEVGSREDAYQLYQEEQDALRLQATDQAKETVSSTKDMSTLEVKTANAVARGIENGSVYNLSPELAKGLEFHQVPVNPDAQAFVIQMKEYYGVDVQFGMFNNDIVNKNVDGFYDPENNLITINPSSPKSIESIAYHEILHAFEKSDPVAFGELKEFVLEYAKKNKELAINYKIASEGVDSSLIEEEFIANLLMDITTSGGGAKFWDSALSEGKNNFVVKFVSDLKRVNAVMKSADYKQGSVDRGRRGLYKVITSIDYALAKFKSNPKAQAKAETKIEEAKAEEVNPVVKETMKQTTDNAIETATVAPKAVSDEKVDKVPLKETKSLKQPAMPPVGKSLKGVSLKEKVKQVEPVVVQGAKKDIKVAKTEPVVKENLTTENISKPIYEQTFEEYLKIQEKEYGQKLTETEKSGMFSEYFNEIESEIKNGNKISRNVFDSLDKMKQDYLIKHHGKNSISGVDSKLELEKQKFQELQDKILKENKSKQDKDNEITQKEINIKNKQISDDINYIAKEIERIKKIPTDKRFNENDKKSLLTQYQLKLDALTKNTADPTFAKKENIKSTTIKGFVNGEVVDVISGNSKELQVKMPNGDIKSLPIGEIELNKNIDRNKIPVSEEPVTKKSIKKEDVKSKNLTHLPRQGYSTVNSDISKLVYALKDVLPETKNGSPDIKNAEKQALNIVNTALNEKVTQFLDENDIDYNVEVRVGLGKNNLMNVDFEVTPKNKLQFVSDVQDIRTMLMNKFSAMEFTLWYRDLVKKVIKPEINPDVKFSQSTARRHETFDTIESSFFSDEELKTNLNESIDKFLYQQEGTKKIYEGYRTTLTTDEKAERTEKSVEDTYKNYHDDWRGKFLNDKKITFNDIVKANATMEYLNRTGRTQEAVDLGAEIATELSDSGRMLQAQTLLRAIGKTGYLSHIRKQINKLNIQGRDTYGRKWNDFSLTKEEEKAIKGTTEKDVDARNRIKTEIGARIVSEMPYSFSERFETYRKFSMLSSFRTHSRNISANLVNKVVHEIDNIFATGIERLAQRDKAKYVHSIVGASVARINKSDTLVKTVDAQWLKMKQSIIEGNKADMATTTSVFGVDKPASRNKIYNKMVTTEKWLMNDVGDVPFVRWAYKDSLYRYMKAQGIKEVSADAHEYALNQALETTFKKSNDMIKAIIRAKRTGKTIGGKVGGFALDVLFPFVKTPLNVLELGAKHTPFVSLALTLGKVAQYKGVLTDKSFKGDPKVFNEIVNLLAQGMTGSLLTAFGAWMLSMGILSPPPEEEYKKAEFLRSVGQTPLALKINNKYYPIAWANPAMTPIIAGASAMNAIQKQENVLLGISKGVLKGTDVIFDLPFLKSLQALFGGTTEDVGVLENAAQVLVSSVASQLIPNLLIDVGKARTVDQKRYNVPEVDDGFGVIKGKEWKWLRKIAYDYGSKLAPENADIKYDIWGNPVKRAETDIGRIALSFISPMLVTTEKMTDVSSEVVRLGKAFSTGKEANDMIPNVPALYLSTKDDQGKESKVYLQSDDTANWIKTNGQTSFKLIDEMIKTEVYKTAGDKQKLQGLQSAYAYSRIKADNEVLVKNGKSTLKITEQMDDISSGLTEMYLQELKENPDAQKITFPRSEIKDFNLSGETIKFTESEQMVLYDKLNTELTKELSDIMSSSEFKEGTATDNKEWINYVISNTRKNIIFDYIEDRIE